MKNLTKIPLHIRLTKVLQALKANAVNLEVIKHYFTL